jgi:hypothetical protein
MSEIPFYDDFVSYLSSHYAPRTRARILRYLRLVAKEFGNPLTVSVEDVRDAYWFYPSSRRRLMVYSLRAYHDFLRKSNLTTT